VLNASHPSPLIHACRISLISTNHSVMSSSLQPMMGLLHSAVGV
jgi:hypothetical protein